MIINWRKVFSFSTKTSTRNLKNAHRHSKIFEDRQKKKSCCEFLSFNGLFAGTFLVRWRLNKYLKAIKVDSVDSENVKLNFKFFFELFYLDRSLIHMRAVYILFMNKKKRKEKAENISRKIAFNKS